MHVKDLVPTKNVTLLSGDGGTGKSLLAAQLAAATVLYTPWLGQEVLGGSVVYLCAEDDMPELHRRFADIARHHGVGLDSLGGIEICCLAGKDAVLAIVNTRGVIEPTALWAEFRRIVIDVRPALVIYDPLADLFGGNEIVRTQARQFVTMLRGLALETDSTALLLGHPSLSGMASGSGSSGSTAWSNSVRSRLYLDRLREKDHEPDPDARVLRTMKANYGPTGGEIRLRWRDGVFVVVGGEGDQAPVPSAKQLAAESAFLGLLSTYEDTGRRVSAQRSPSFAPTVFAGDERGKDIGRKALEAAMNRLLEAGRIRVVEYGPPSRRYNKLEVSR
jgi:RecA-family ATPase